MAAEVRYSVSTWRQEMPAAASTERLALMTDVAEWIGGLSERRLLVGIDGATASGKTSFGHELAARLAATGRPVLRASLDDFKRPWRERHLYDRESGEGYYRNAFDLAAVRELLLDPARPSGSGEVVLCARDPLTQVDHSDVVTEAAENAVLVVDGVFAFRPELAACWDVRIWLDVPRGLSLQRAVGRDASMAASAGEAEALHRDRYAASEAIYEAEADPRGKADIVIDNADFAQPRIVVGPIRR